MPMPVLAEGAARETWEEAHAHVQIQAPYTFFDIPLIGQIYVLFRHAAVPLAAGGYAAAVEPAQLCQAARHSAAGPGWPHPTRSIQIQRRALM